MREEEIRKRGVFNEYLKLVEKDVKEFFDFKSLIRAACPACASGDCTEEFEKLGFRYVTCNNCGTLYVNPRPPYETLKEFYSSSSSTSFWVNKFFKPVAEVRREKIFKPRAEYIREVLDVGKELVIGDIGAGFGIFLEELRKLIPNNRYVAIEPSREMAGICTEKKLEVKNLCLEDMAGMQGRFDLLTAFELMEHLQDPTLFLEKTISLLKPGGLLFLTTLSGSGFDIQLLWQRSKSITPPHHINFFNPSSAGYLLGRIGFDVVEVSTPGKLDWDIVEGMIKREGISPGRFWSFLSREGSEECKKELQGWISRNNLSSHMRLVARKPV